MKAGSKKINSFAQKKYEKGPIRKRMTMRKPPRSVKKEPLSHKYAIVKTGPLLNRIPHPYNDPAENRILWRMKTLTEECIRLSVTSDVWVNYNTAIRHAERVEKATNIKIEPPFSQEMLIAYVSFLLAEREVKAATVDKALSGLLKWESLCGFPTTTLRTNYVKAILTGFNNRNKALERAGIIKRKKRRAITLQLLRYFGDWLNRTNTLSDFNKQVFWTIATTAFFGSFRIGELLSKRAKGFDDTCTLLTRDVAFKTEKTEKREEITSARIRVKSPKIERISSGDFVTLYEIKSEEGIIHELCPIASLCKYIEMANKRGTLVSSQPFFRLESGLCVSKDRLNKVLKQAFSELSDPWNSFSCHSFRMGVSSHMQNWQFSEEEIQGQGRWSSTSWELYCRLPVDRRREISKKLATLFSNL